MNGSVKICLAEIKTHKMLNKLVWILLLCFTSCYLVEAQRWRAKSSLILGNLGLKTSFLSPIIDRGSININDDIGIENLNLIEGDIIPDDNVLGGRTAKKGKLWPKGRIPYVITSTLDDHKSEIKDAMKYIENVSCLRFVQRTMENDYINMYKGEGCFSKIGMSGGAQTLSLGSSCFKVGLIMHELLHAAGFYHEQSRSDRDKYIRIHWGNIMKGYEKNFVKNKPDVEVLLSPYDYESIMHYSEYSFTKDRANGLKTMTSKKKGVVINGPSHKMLSASDIKRISILYNCTAPRHSK